MTSTRDEVLADLSIFLNPFLPSGALTDSMLRRWYKFFFQFKARATASDSSGSSEGVSPYKQISLEQPFIEVMVTFMQAASASLIVLITASIKF